VKMTRPIPRACEMLRNFVSFDAEELLAPRPNPTMEDHPFSAALDFLYIYIRSYPPYLEAVPPSASLGCPVLW
jgi:hypothetical protein